MLRVIVSFASLNASYNPVHLVYENGTVSINHWYCTVQCGAPYGPKNTLSQCLMCCYLFGVFTQVLKP